jgi:dTDP-4-amino-4,6-dideoxygalactose transaminase
VIPISKPLIGEEEQRAVRDVLESGAIAQGPRVAAFEQAFAAYIGVRHAIATSNGTTALHAALLAHGIGPGDEVITTPFTFIASVNAILFCGARPVFVDVDATATIDATQIEAAITPRTRAIMPVHLYGQPADLAAIMAIAGRHDLAVVEDACQAHGARFGSRMVGSFGTGCFSFYATKNMTTGEGGMITTDDEALAQRARRLISHGMRVRYYHETLGYNYRMTDIAAAIGVEQLARLPAFNTRRAANAAYFDHCLADLPGVQPIGLAPGRTHVYHQYVLRIGQHAGLSRDALAAALLSDGIATAIYYPVPVHQQESLRACGLGQVSLPLAEQLAREVLAIPVHPALSTAEAGYIADRVQFHTLRHETVAA